MNAKNYYIIDTSSLIQLSRFYPMNIFSTVWKYLEDFIKNGFMVSHSEVKKEIDQRDDELKRWAKRQRGFFRPITPQQVIIVKEILDRYPSLAHSENEYATADPFIIALAIEQQRSPQSTLSGKRKGKMIITEERSRGQRVRIPFVCQQYGIQCLNIIELFKEEDWKF